MKVVAVVLAAGASTRFGSAKLMAPLAGKPMLQHVLDAVSAAGLSDVVVVLGAEASAVEQAITWRHEVRVVNGRPADGLASSLRVGLDAVVGGAGWGRGADGALVVLGDQPQIRSSVIRQVLAAADPAVPGGPAAEASFVRVRYDHDDAPNPVLIRRRAWALAAGISGDRGLGPLLASRPELVAEVRAEGANPDVDTPEDLARLARLA